MFKIKDYLVSDSTMIEMTNILKNNNNTFTIELQKYLILTSQLDNVNFFDIINITRTTDLSLCSICPYYILLANNFEPNNLILNTACYMTNLPIFNNIVNNYKIYPNINSLDSAISSVLTFAQLDSKNNMIKHDMNNCAKNNGIYNFINTILNFKVVPSITTVISTVNLIKFIQFNMLEKYDCAISNILILLLENGLSLNRQIIKILLSISTIKFDLKCFQDSDIVDEFDEELYYILYKQDSIKNYHTLFTNTKIFKLRSLFTHAPISIVEKFIQDNKIRPDRYCFEFAASSNYCLISYLINKGCTPTFKAIKWYKESLNKKTYLNLDSNEFFKMICEENQTMEYMVKAYEFDL